MGRLNRKQRQAVWITLVAALLCGGVAPLWSMGVVIVVGAVVVWKLGGAVERPEIATVKSVRCGGCGSIGEPHWKTCPRCGATNWV
ncbi:MAG TPA: hypothetical protein VKU19_23865 [Bryobacteraceae bacterium]|nr:hypothetical protein [Bryobacteraceae bacterium]